MNTALGSTSKTPAHAHASGARRPVVVILTDIDFWQQTYGSHARIILTLKAIEEHCDLKVFCFRSVGQNVKAAFKALGLQAELVSYKVYEKTAPAVPVGRGGHRELRSFYKHSWVAAAADYLERTRPDFVLIEYIDRSYLLDAVPEGTMTILDTHDVMSHRAMAFQHYGRSVRLQFSAAQEAEILRMYDSILAISQADCETFKTRLGMRNVIYAPHTVLLAERTVRERDGRRLIFTGSDAEANVIGLLWFLDQVWPMLEDHFVLDVVGKVSNAVAEAPKNVNLHGRVDSLDAYYEAADIAINPVFVGGGIKIKTLDAMRYGVPCVTTAEGARGLEDAVGKGLFLVGSRGEFVQTMLDLAVQPDVRRRAEIDAQTYVATRHAPEVAFRDLIMFLKNA
ncbi:glycosyltransferase [Acuticoccus mangrovi]|uniref:Glycosyltransferase n=1 Tax=Acuticoccus mangrovi TaxID=2796142 RepID=A0A934IN87_9HYPH|nr:glycosyltransferase [Acuticoccus mangrovi]MBJ3775005.1 glycosyltransferase [Acuticoccus mangrovi]